VDLDAAYDAASARIVLGDALAATGNHEAGRMEWEAALTAFEAYGAPLRAADVRVRLRGATSGLSAPGPVHAELVDCGEHWLLRYAGSEVVLPALKGVGYVARLVADPGREVAATELAGSAVEQPALPALDEEARAAYRRRLAEVEDDLAEAVRVNDEARRQLAERDRDYLVAELRSAVGLGGRIRGTGGDSERARTAVTRSLRYALARVSELHPELGRHLACTVRTGTWCSYVPDPLAPIQWKVT
jgi:hypothetical protein